MFSDGILPANEGRGYVLRRLLRRAVRCGLLCGLDGSFLHPASEPLVASSEVYPQLAANRQYLVSAIKAEEERFLTTIREGMGCKDELAWVGAGGVLAGEAAFRLYDTFGFPLELTVEIAGEHQVQVDGDGFRKALEHQRSQARPPGSRWTP